MNNNKVHQKSTKCKDEDQDILSHSKKLGGSHCVPITLVGLQCFLLSWVQ